MEEGKEKRVLSIEKKLDTIEQRKDTQIFSEIASDLPSAAKVKIYKVSDLDGSKEYITQIAAEILTRRDVHQFLQSRFSKRFGGGKYILEFLNSEGDPVKEHEISILVQDETSKERETLLEEKERLLQKEKSLKTEEASAVSGLISSITPLVLNREDKIETFQRLLLMAKELRGGSFEEFLQNPEKVAQLREIFGVKEKEEEDIFGMVLKLKLLESLSPSTTKQKSLLDELGEHAEKAEALRRLLGVEQRETAVPAPIATRSGFDELAEMAGKFNTIEPFMKKLFGTPSPPPKNFTEFLTNAISVLGPVLPQVTSKIVEGMTQVATIKANAQLTALQFKQQQGKAEFSGTKEAQEEKKQAPSDFYSMFDSLVAELIKFSPWAIPPDEFTSAIANSLKRAIQKNPSIVGTIGDTKSTFEKLSLLLMERLGITQDIASQYLTDILQNAGFNIKIEEEVKK